MKRRLNIACAIAHNPKIIIMDEPTVGIDPQSRNHILQSVRTLNEKGCTVIYTSHYMEEVESLCSRIAIMDHGKIIAEGTKEDLTALITDRKTVTITLANMLNDSNIKKIKEIKDIYGVIGVDINDDTVTITSEMDTNNLDKIILFLTSNRIHIRNVESKMPDLETVFLTLTGRKLRD
jgi:ABC-2 type transport system ATP-binding protein